MVTGIFFRPSCRTKLPVNQKLERVVSVYAVTPGKTRKLFQWSSNHAFNDIYWGVKTRHWGYRWGRQMSPLHLVVIQSDDLTWARGLTQNWFYYQTPAMARYTTPTYMSNRFGSSSVTDLFVFIYFFKKKGCFWPFSTIFLFSPAEQTPGNEFLMDFLVLPQ